MKSFVIQKWPTWLQQHLVSRNVDFSSKNLRQIENDDSFITVESLQCLPDNFPQTMDISTKSFAVQKMNEALNKIPKNVDTIVFLNGVKLDGNISETDYIYSNTLLPVNIKNRSQALEYLTNDENPPNLQDIQNSNGKLLYTLIQDKVLKRRKSINVDENEEMCNFEKEHSEEEENEHIEEEEKEEEKHPEEEEKPEEKHPEEEKKLEETKPEETKLEEEEEEKPEEEEDEPNWLQNASKQISESKSTVVKGLKSIYKGRSSSNTENENVKNDKPEVILKKHSNTVFDINTKIYCNSEKVLVLQGIITPPLLVSLASQRVIVPIENNSVVMISGNRKLVRIGSWTINLESYDPLHFSYNSLSKVQPQEQKSSKYKKSTIKTRNSLRRLHRR